MDRDDRCRTGLPHARRPCLRVLEAGRHNRLVRLDAPRREPVPPRRAGTSGRVPGGDPHARAGSRPLQHERARTVDGPGRRELRRPHVRRTRPRPVRRPDRHRRPERDRRHANGVLMARRAPGRRRREDRRPGHLTRRRRRVELTRGRCAVGGRRGDRIVDEPPERTRAAGPRQVGRDRGIPRLAAPRPHRSAAARDPRRGVLWDTRGCRLVRECPLVAPCTEGGDDAGLHDAGSAGLRLRDGAGAAGLQRTRRPEATLARASRSRAVDLPRCRLRCHARRGHAMVRPLPARSGATGSISRNGSPSPRRTGAGRRLASMPRPGPSGRSSASAAAPRSRNRARYSAPPLP